MGCDIHIYTEYRNPGELTWQSADTTSVEEEGTKDEYINVSHTIDTGRNYGLFGLIAGVRIEYEQSLACKYSWPEDTTETSMYQKDRWDGDGHSHSWFTLDEIKTHLLHLALTQHDIPDWVTNSYTELKDNMEALKPSGASDHDVRILFLFDN